MMLPFRISLLIAFLLPLLVDADEPVNDIETKKTQLNNTSRISPQPLLEVVEEQLKMLRTLEIDKAYHNYTTKVFRSKTTLDDFKRLIARYKILTNNNLFQFQSFFIEDDIASIGGELHSKNGEVIPVEFDFVMEDGKWKIMGIQIYKNELPLPATGND